MDQVAFNGLLDLESMFNASVQDQHPRFLERSNIHKYLISEIDKNLAKFDQKGNETDSCILGASVTASQFTRELIRVLCDGRSESALELAVVISEAFGETISARDPSQSLPQFIEIFIPLLLKPKEITVRLSSLDQRLENGSENVLEDGIVMRSERESVPNIDLINRYTSLVSRLANTKQTCNIASYPATVWEFNTQSTLTLKVIPPDLKEELIFWRTRRLNFTKRLRATARLVYLCLNNPLANDDEIKQLISKMNSIKHNELNNAERNDKKAIKRKFTVEKRNEEEKKKVMLANFWKRTSAQSNSPFTPDLVRNSDSIETVSSRSLETDITKENNDLSNCNNKSVFFSTSEDIDETVHVQGFTDEQAPQNCQLNLSKKDWFDWNHETDTDTNLLLQEFLCMAVSHSVYYKKILDGIVKETNRAMVLYPLSDISEPREVQTDEQLRHALKLTNYSVDDLPNSPNLYYSIFYDSEWKRPPRRLLLHKLPSNCTPQKPVAQEPSLDYDLDSDEEWYDQYDAEDISNIADNDDNELEYENEEEEGRKDSLWLVPDTIIDGVSITEYKANETPQETPLVKFKCINKNWKFFLDGLEQQPVVCHYTTLGKAFTESELQDTNVQSICGTLEEPGSKQDYFKRLESLNPPIKRHMNSTDIRIFAAFSHGKETGMKFIIDDFHKLNGHLVKGSIESISKEILIYGKRLEDKKAHWYVSNNACKKYHIDPNDLASVLYEKRKISRLSIAQLLSATNFSARLSAICEPEVENRELLISGQC